MVSYLLKCIIKYRGMELVLRSILFLRRKIIYIFLDKILCYEKCGKLERIIDIGELGVYFEIR